jgi:uncharacterized protein (DUF697 family)/tellurite resistance protein
MHADAQRALLNIVIRAALADGQKAEVEREAIRGVAESLGGQGASSALTGVYQDVLLKRVSLEQAAALLTDPAHRQLAYEMAVCVCDADGQQSEAEQRFLGQLQGVLGLGQSAGALPAETGEAVRAADAIAQRADQPLTAVDPAWAPEVLAAPVLAAPVLASSVPSMPEAAPVPARPAASGPTAVVLDAAASAQLDKTILNYAILNGALELLPQSWASVAIIPLQVKMVYRIGKAHGIELDQGHIKEFLATVGVGLTSQYLEQFGRKLLGGLLGKAAGRTLGGLAGAATGVAFSFATTYALGHLAKRYYAGGRVMSTDVLRQTYQGLLGPAKNLQQQYLPAMQQQAATLDAAKVMAMVRG